MTTRDRFRGLMLGTAVGDCLGRPVEGHRRVPDSFIDEVLTSPPRLIYTDDTVMTMALARSLLDSGRFDGAHMAMRFARDYHADPHRGYGRNVVEVFERVLRGVPWHEAAGRQFGGEGSYGNGAAMRVAPVALWAHPDVERAAQLAAETARVTHTHNVGVEGAMIQAVAACHALASIPTPDLLFDLDRRIRTKEFRARFDMLPSCLEADDDERARLHLGHWVAADKSVLTALYCFLMASDFTDAVVRALRMGGDTDTIGAMTGALAGARFGASSIPEAWLAVEGHDTLVSLADDLHSHSGR